VAAGWYDVLTSSNGSDWEIRYKGAEHEILGLCYGNGLYVAVGWYAIYVSSNLTDWTFSPSDYFLSSITYADGRFAAGVKAYPNTLGGILESTNGTSWNFIGLETNLFVTGIAFGNGKFLCVGYKTYNTGPDEPRVYVSEDAEHWVRPANTPGRLLNGVAWLNNQFVAVGGPYGEDESSPIVTPVLFSADGANWTLTGDIGGEYLFGISYGNGRYVAVGAQYNHSLDGYDAVSIFSTNGVDWDIGSPRSQWSLRSVAFGTDKFLGVGYGGSLTSSTDGIDWFNESRGTVANLNGVTCTSNLLVAYGGSYGLTMLSSDGISWTNIYGSRSNAALGGLPWSFRRMIYTNGLYIGAVVDEYDSPILRSSNAINWDFVAHASFSVEGLTYANGLYFALGGDQYGSESYESRPQMAVSSDGRNWRTQSPSSKDGKFYDVAYGNGVFIAVGGAGQLPEIQIMSSLDGFSWADSSVLSEGIFRGVAYGNGRFVAVNDYGQIYTSFNGTNWLTTLDLDGEGFFTGAVYANGLFLTLGSTWTSNDGLSWVRRNPDAAQSLNGGTFYKGCFFLAGDGGAILQSGSLAADNPPFGLSPERASPISLILRGGAARAFQIESSSTISTAAQWASFVTVYPDTNFFRIIDPQPPSGTSRFYRARLLP
jgi:hypothetical protein